MKYHVEMSYLAHVSSEINVTARSPLRDVNVPFIKPVHLIIS